MTMEILYLTAQMQRWLNLRVARHLEAQAAKLKAARPLLLQTHGNRSLAKNLGADGPGGSVGLDCTGLPAGCYDVGEAETDAAAGAGGPDGLLTKRHSDPVHA